MLFLELFSVDVAVIAVVVAAVAAVAAVIPITYGAPFLRLFWAGAKVTPIIYPALSSRCFRASQ